MSLTAFLFGIALLALPAYITVALHTGLETIMAKAFAKMVLWTGLLALCLWTLTTQMHWAFSLPAVALMTVGGAAITVHWARQSQRIYLIPMTAAFAATITFTLLWLWLLVVGLHNAFIECYMLPLAGMLLGAMIETNSAALATYHSGLQHHGQLYEYLLGNGANHREATTYFLRRALQSAMTPLLHRWGRLVVFTTPVVMWMLIMSGWDAWTAFEWQLVLAAAMLFCSVAALLVMVFVARRYAFDPYEALITIRKNEAPAPSTTQEDTTPQEHDIPQETPESRQQNIEDIEDKEEVTTNPQETPQITHDNEENNWLSLEK